MGRNETEDSVIDSIADVVAAIYAVKCMKAHARSALAEPSFRACHVSAFYDEMQTVCVGLESAKEYIVDPELILCLRRACAATRAFWDVVHRLCSTPAVRQDDLTALGKLICIMDKALRESRDAMAGHWKQNSKVINPNCWKKTGTE